MVQGVMGHDLGLNDGMPGNGEGCLTGEQL